jgi:hypothetical protein
MGSRTPATGTALFDSVLRLAREKSLAKWPDTEIRKAVSWALLAANEAGRTGSEHGYPELDALLRAWLEENPSWQSEFLERLHTVLCDPNVSHACAQPPRSRQTSNSFEEYAPNLCVTLLATRLSKNVLNNQVSLVLDPSHIK